ncbi:MAG: glycosyltransferase, partial [Sphingobacteriaceae bacterium]
SMPSLATPTANTAFAGLISIVAPLYNEVANVAQLVSRVAAVMAQHDYDYELILVNDGSRDQSWALMQELAAHDRQSDAEEAPARSSPNLLMTSKLNLMQHA